MLEFKEYESKFNKPVEVQKIFVWFAYKGGKVEQFETLEEANKFSANVEKVQVNKEEVENYWKELREAKQNAIDLWYKDLREEYSELTDKQFELCYNEAYERGHSSGYDEVASYMYDVVGFAEQLLKTVN